MHTRGWNFEHEIKKACKYYLRNGMAIIHKVEVPWGKTKTGEIIYRSKTPFDFEGCLKRGRHIGFEVKSTIVPRLAVGGKTGLVKHQWFALQDYGFKAGSTAFLLWEHNGQVLRVWPKGIKEQLGNGRKSIVWKLGENIKKEDGVWMFLEGII